MPTRLDLIEELAEESFDIESECVLICKCPCCHVNTLVMRVSRKADDWDPYIGGHKIEYNKDKIRCDRCGAVVEPDVFTQRTDEFVRDS